MEDASQWNEWQKTRVEDMGMKGNGDEREREGVQPDMGIAGRTLGSGIVVSIIVNSSTLARAFAELPSIL
jgi:acetylornithine/succinyldiaminopimelate/putrescine aminotransferase